MLTRQHPCCAPCPVVCPARVFTPCAQEPNWPKGQGAAAGRPQHMTKSHDPPRLHAHNAQPLNTAAAVVVPPARQQSPPAASVKLTRPPNAGGAPATSRRSKCCVNCSRGRPGTDSSTKQATAGPSRRSSWPAGANMGEGEGEGGRAHSAQREGGTSCGEQEWCQVGVGVGCGGFLRTHCMYLDGLWHVVG